MLPVPITSSGSDKKGFLGVASQSQADDDQSSAAVDRMHPDFMCAQQIATRQGAADHHRPPSRPKLFAGARCDVVDAYNSPSEGRCHATCRHRQELAPACLSSVSAARRLLGTPASILPTPLLAEPASISEREGLMILLYVGLVPSMVDDSLVGRMSE